MVTYHKLTLENIEAISARAKLKDDGCYTFRGIMYRVKNGHVTHYALGSVVVENFGHFIVTVGTYCRDSDGMKLLKGI